MTRVMNEKNDGCFRKTARSKSKKRFLAEVKVAIDSIKVREDVDVEKSRLYAHANFDFECIFLKIIFYDIGQVLSAPVTYYCILVDIFFSLRFLVVI